mmetsp:Transcript_64597/g.107036  ORF Transcript_64597/g.107036 Transcript_64597/m.107036 type:complete len:256 (+) Transcript_64597:262-1029(+)
MTPAQRGLLDIPYNSALFPQPTQEIAFFSHIHPVIPQHIRHKRYIAHYTHYHRPLGLTLRQSIKRLPAGCSPNSGAVLARHHRLYQRCHKSVVPWPPPAHFLLARQLLVLLLALGDRATLPLLDRKLVGALLLLVLWLLFLWLALPVQSAADLAQPELLCSLPGLLLGQTVLWVLVELLCCQNLLLLDLVFRTSSRVEAWSRLHGALLSCRSLLRAADTLDFFGVDDTLAVWQTNNFLDLQSLVELVECVLGPHN